MKTSIAIIGATQNVNDNDITASPFGLRLVAIVAIAFCLVGALLLTFYNEKKIMRTIVGEQNAPESADVKTPAASESGETEEN